MSQSPDQPPLGDQLARRLSDARRFAIEAGRITLEYFQRDDLAVERKADDSPVTAADRRAEAHLRRSIAAAWPEDGIFGEEMAEQPGRSGFRWIVDPIDGTKSFIHGVPLYGTLVAVERNAEPLLGVIHMPALGETVYAARGQGAWYQRADQPRRAARVSACRTLADALFLTSEVDNFEQIGRRDVYDRLQSAARLTRTWGDCYGYLMVATGRAELMIDPIVSVWDLAALMPVIQESGGKFTDWQGTPSIYSGQAIATNGLLFEEVLALVRSDESLQ